MWSTIVSFVFKAVDTTYFKIAWIASLCFVVGSLTYSYQAHKYESQISDLRAQMATQVAEMEKDNNERLTRAIEERDTANSRLSALADSNTALLNRLRKSTASSSPAKGASASDASSESLSRCRNLLRESAGLLTEACERFGKCAANNDALVELLK